MAHKFHHQHAHKLDKKERQKWQGIEKFLKVLEPFDDMVFVDIGVGTGYFAVPVAKKFPNATVVGADIQPEMLTIVEEKIEKENLKNLKTVLSEENKVPIESKTADRVLVANVFHELHHPQKFLEEVKRILKNNGKLIVIDWKPIETEEGPPLEERLEPETVKKELEKAGFKKIKIDSETYPFHYIITGKLEE
jgi:ubiquinone/menaquinone biosynthesis C-methylase UbiE